MSRSNSSRNTTNKRPIKNNVDQTARKLGIASLIISIVAIVVPVAQQELIRRDAKSESIAIIARKAVELPLQDGKQKFGDKKRLVYKPWSITLVNNSSKTISIIDVQIEKITKGNIIHEYYHGLNGGLINKDGSEVGLPIQLLAGESKAFFAKVGILVPTIAYYALLPEFEKNSGQVDYNIATWLLAQKNIDLYGNPVNIKVFPEGGPHGGYLLNYLSQAFSPEFSINITTGAGLTLSKPMQTSNWEASNEAKGD